MPIELYLAFILACIVLALTPGPNMSLFVANGTTHGTAAALATVGGSAVGLGLLAAVAALGMSSLMVILAEWFDVIRWLGAAYLVWLGYGRLRRALTARTAATAPVPTRGRWFWQGMAVSLSNPKVMLFLGAFFPQFIDPAAPAAPQLTLLAATFVVTIAAVDTVLAVAVGSARSWFSDRRRRLAEGISGTLLVCGGIWLAAARRS